MRARIECAICGTNEKGLDYITTTDVVGQLTVCGPCNAETRAAVLMVEVLEEYEKGVRP